jgi:hypothetical protein
LVTGAKLSGDPHPPQGVEGEGGGVGISVALGVEAVADAFVDFLAGAPQPA